MNRAVEITTGQWVMQLDDADYLLPGAGEAMLEAISRAAPGESVLMFGVQIVDGAGREVVRVLATFLLTTSSFDYAPERT